MPAFLSPPISQACGMLDRTALHILRVDDGFPWNPFHGDWMVRHMKKRKKKKNMLSSVQHTLPPSKSSPSPHPPHPRVMIDDGLGGLSLCYLWQTEKEPFYQDEAAPSLLLFLCLSLRYVLYLGSFQPTSSFYTRITLWYMTIHNTYSEHTRK